MVFLLAVVLSAGLLVNISASRLPEDKTHKFTAVVVSVNTAAKTITFTLDDGTEKTSPVEGKAEDVYKDLKAGDKVELTCHDTDKGEHKAIQNIVRIKDPTAQS
jgi:translation initiation factor IF-1